jgi:hypothetical protein
MFLHGFALDYKTGMTLSAARCGNEIINKVNVPLQLADPCRQRRAISSETCSIRHLVLCVGLHFLADWPVLPDHIFRITVIDGHLKFYPGLSLNVEY